MTDDQGSGESIYQEHLDFSEQLIGIKEGRLFQGRLNVSRLNIEEATVNV